MATTELKRLYTVLCKKAHQYFITGDDDNLDAINNVLDSIDHEIHLRRTWHAR